VQWVCEDNDGVVWGATGSGIVRIKGNHLRVITRKHGLFDDNVYCIVPDDFGQLWVDSGRGVFRVSRQSLNDLAEGRRGDVECEVFDGLESVKATDKTVQERVGCKSADGRIWFPGPQGVVMIDPARIPTNRIAPPVNIDRVVANGREISHDEPTIVPPGEGELEFHFNALTFVARQKVRFRYRLEGYDRDWVDPGDRRMAFYTNLKPGKYTFRVTASNADGIWNERGDALSLELRPRFSQTVWFYLLCAGGIAGTVAAASLRRIRRLKREQQALQENRDRLEAEVQNRTTELAEANASLQHEIEEHKHTAVELRERTRSLEAEIEERKQMQSEVERVHRQLLQSSRQAGMAEVATSVLHNVGNVLNSVNTSASVVAERLQASKADGVARVADLLEQHRNELPVYLAANGRTDQVIRFLRTLAHNLAAERKFLLDEATGLSGNIEHIKEIVAMQQSYARIAGITETVSVTGLVDDALRMNGGALARHDVKLVREYPAHPAVATLDKHKVLQILVNLVRNAKYACDDSGRSDKQVTVRVSNGEARVRITVADNGVGIAPENLTRIFSHGFTTRKDGHGFGLHSGALAAREMGGTLRAHSDGPGRGAIFTLELPVDSPQAAAQAVPDACEVST
jgi:signal transduction histidine kinase